jgi:hypothetical protein
MWHWGFHSRLVARIPGLKSETWGTHRLVAEGVRDEEKDCRSGLVMQSRLGSGLLQPG